MKTALFRPRRTENPQEKEGRRASWRTWIIGSAGEPLFVTPRCNKDLIEEGLFALRRDLLTQLQSVLFDTTSIYFEGQGEGTIGRRDHSKDHRPDLKQMIVGAVLDGQGRSICWELWPGNKADVTTLIPVVDRLRSRFGVTKVCIVADRGMISKETIEELERPERGSYYILGARMRSQNEVKVEVLARAGRYRVVHFQRQTSEDPWPLKVKEVQVEGRRYIVCLNEDEARKDAADREAIVASLQERLRSGERSLVGNKGYRRYLTSTGSDHFQIDEAKIKEAARYDGKWVLRTNTDLDTAEVALQFKRLWMVEAWFRSSKSLSQTRPIIPGATKRSVVTCFARSWRWCSARSWKPGWPATVTTSSGPT